MLQVGLDTVSMAGTQSVRDTLGRESSQRMLQDAQLSVECTSPLRIHCNPNEVVKQ